MNGIPDGRTDIEPGEASEGGADAVKKAKTQMRLVVGSIGFLALLSFVVMALALLPYAPLAIYSYEPKRTEVCPGELIRVDVDSELILSGAQQVYSVSIQPEWVVVDVKGLTPGQTVEGAETTVPAEGLEPGRNIIESDVLRPAQPQPGIWRHGAEVTVRGTAYGVPRPQTLQPESDKLTTVLPPEHPKCEGTERPEGGF